MSRWPGLLVYLGLGGCVVGPTYHPPTSTVPEHWSMERGEPRSTQALRSFWARFEDPVLSRLIQQVVENNYDLKIAGERIRAAQDATRIAGALGLPQVSVGAAAESRRETQTVDWPPPSPQYGEYPYYALGLNASWELDLFGETAHRKQSAQAAADAAIEERRGALISLTAAMASKYLSYRATELRLQCAFQTLHIARQTQMLAHRGFDAGERSHLDVSEADSQVHAVEATIPPLEARLKELSHAIALLVARAPAAFTEKELSGDTRLHPVPPLALSIPSEVIAQRPDIRRAEREYAQATAKVGVAVAELYPHFSIPLSIGPAASELHDIFQHASLLWRVGLDGTTNIYAGGQLTARLDAARGAEQAALFSYRQAVLKAFGEVEDAITQRTTEETRYQALTAQLADSAQASHEAQQRYEAGQISLLPVLQDQQQVYAAQDAQIVSLLHRNLAEIDMFRALGGDWDAVELAQVSGRVTAP